VKVPGRGPRPCPAACRTARSRSDPPAQEGRCKATRKREFKPPWREAGSDPPAQRGSEAGSNLRPIDSCITQLEAQGPYRTCNESKEEEAQRERERLVCYCPKTSASTAPCTSRRMCCPTHCTSYYAPCQPLGRAFSGWIRSSPPTQQERRHSYPHQHDHAPTPCGFVLGTKTPCSSTKGH